MVKTILFVKTMKLKNMENLTKEQIEQKKEHLEKLLQEANALKDELVAAGAWPLGDDDLDGVAGGSRRPR